MRLVLVLAALLATQIDAFNFSIAFMNGMPTGQKCSQASALEGQFPTTARECAELILTNGCDPRTFSWAKDGDHSCWCVYQEDYCSATAAANHTAYTITIETDFNYRFADVDGNPTEGPVGYPQIEWLDGQWIDLASSTGGGSVTRPRYGQTANVICSELGYNDVFYDVLTETSESGNVNPWVYMNCRQEYISGDEDNDYSEFGYHFVGDYPTSQSDCRIGHGDRNSNFYKQELNCIGESYTDLPEVGQTDRFMAYGDCEIVNNCVQSENFNASARVVSGSEIGQIVGENGYAAYYEPGTYYENDVYDNEFPAYSNCYVETLQDSRIEVEGTGPGNLININLWEQYLEIGGVKPHKESMSEVAREFGDDYDENVADIACFVPERLSVNQTVKFQANSYEGWRTTGFRLCFSDPECKDVGHARWPAQKCQERCDDPGKFRDDQCEKHCTESCASVEMSAVKCEPKHVRDSDWPRKKCWNDCHFGTEGHEDCEKYCSGCRFPWSDHCESIGL